jgi:predicted kinase
MDCNGNCPVVYPRPYFCCRNCGASQKEYHEAGGLPDFTPEQKEIVKKAWGPCGYATEHGCNLPRELRPDHCRRYNCADKILVMGSASWNGHWPTAVREIDRAGATEEKFLEAARGAWAELQGRHINDVYPDQSSWDRAMQYADGPTLYVLQGLLGSGKSSWARKFLLRHPRARIVSADSFRKMLHGKYEYHAEMDDVITNAMCANITELVKAGYDPVVDCGNLTRERRRPWTTAALQGSVKRWVAILLPQGMREWHLMRRAADPHWNVDWGKIFDGEMAALEPIDKEAEGFEAIVEVNAREVSARKILILSASPVRDKHIDAMLAAKLRQLGHEVEVVPCLREGRAKVLEYQPDIVLVPPIRNPNSRDFVEELKRFGCAVITRHTEPSCSWQDWKKMGPEARHDILGAFEYKVDLELVWSEDEADILNRRPGAPKAVAVGAIGLDIYFDEMLTAKLKDKPAFCQKYGFDPTRPTLLISSPWGFADSSPDLHTEDILSGQRDAAGRDRHLAMVRTVHAKLNTTWNILLSVHAGLDPAPYAALAADLKVPLDAESPMLNMLPNCDVLIHAGSTASVSAHLLGIPAFQFGDVNAEGLTNWWGVGESPISRVSPRFETVEKLVEAIVAHTGASNADPAVIKELETGRYGPIDGKASDRAVRFIGQAQGHFRYSWPRSPRDYRQLTIQRDQREFFLSSHCNVCDSDFYILTDEYIQQLATAMSKAANAPVEKLMDILRPKMGYCCPVCAARLVRL